MFLSKNKYLPFLILFLIVFISRLPFLSAGYGVEEDSWGIALAAFHTKLTGIYEPSRFPGHPVQELIYSALWGAGPAVFNGLCAFFSALAAVFFALILDHFRFRYAFPAALAFAFVPVFYISSCYTIDFAWSEALVLMSMYCFLKNKYIPTGIFLGLAVGCRVTCGVMLLPYLIMMWNGDLKDMFIRMLKIAVPMAVVAVLAFLPVILQFGTSFFMYYDQFPYPPITKVFYKMIIGVWGIVGVVALAAMVFVAVLQKRKQNRGGSFEVTLDKKIIVAAVVLIILYCISYFRLPQKSGYMIPVIPFVILLLGYYLNALNFKILCYALIASSFVCSINLTDKLRGAEYSGYALTFTVSGQELFFDPLSGPVFSDYSKRKQKIKYTEEAIWRSGEALPKTVIIAGWWYNEIMVTKLEQAPNDHVIFEPYIDAAKMKSYISDGYRIFYMPEQNLYNDLMYNMQETDKLANPF